MLRKYVTYNLQRGLLLKVLPATFILCLSSIYTTAQQYFSDPDTLAEAVNTSMNGGVFIVSNGI